MLSIVLILLIWTCNLTPLWVNIVSTILLGIRFTYRCGLLIGRFLKGDYRG